MTEGTSIEELLLDTSNHLKAWQIAASLECTREQYDKIIVRAAALSATFERDQKMERDAYEIGEEWGKNAASWLDIGDKDAARILLQGYVDGDPEIMDIPGNPLSGEYADDITPTKLYESVGASPDELDNDDWVDTTGQRLCEAFESGYVDRFWAVAHTRCWAMG